MIAAADCPACPSDTAIPDLLEDDEGLVVAVAYECVACGCVWLEPRD